MGNHSFNIAIALAEFSFLFACVVAALQDANCVCRGPTHYYREIGCTPIFKNPKDCCPIIYDCDIWKTLPADKCLINGHVYEWGEYIRAQDKNPCDNCTCGSWFSPTPIRGISAMFQRGGIMNCQMPSMADNRLRQGCYYSVNITNCCGFVYCLKPGEFRPTCIVDGKTYKDGENFVPSTEPEKRCRCGIGYAGKNVEPFCISPKHTWCSNVLYEVESIRRFCAPTYRHGTSLQKDCNSSFRCQNPMDRVINGTNTIPHASNSTTNEPEDPNMLCHYGTLRMRIGDELNQDTDDSSTCMRCVCEVPPIPTCQRRSEEDCPEPIVDLWAYRLVNADQKKIVLNQ